MFASARRKPDRKQDGDRFGGTIEYGLVLGEPCWNAPRLVLTAGGRQSPAWLSKLRRSQRDWFHKQDIDAIIAQLDPSDPGPTRATLDQQALFLLGYHHQRAHNNAARTASAAAKAIAQAPSGDSASADSDQP